MTIRVVCQRPSLRHGSAAIGGLVLSAMLTWQFADPLPARAADAGSEPGAETQDGAVTFALPDPLPPVPAFDDMVGFTSDGQTRMQFALDPGSYLPGKRQAQITIAARSASGVLNLGYYGFDCLGLRYQMLAYGGADGSWKPATRPAWREVRDGETRNRQFRAVYGAVCQLGGRATATAEQMLERLANPDKNLYTAP
ncbi:MAG: CNP1-like family protein [Burkholderiaceae bacterium]